MLNGRTETHGSAELGVVRVRHVLAGELRDGVRPARLADRADRRHVALLDVERVLAEHLARRELDEPLERVAASRRAASSALYVPITFTRIVRTGLVEHGVDARRSPAAWTMCVQPAASSVSRSGSRTSPSTKRKFGWPSSSVPASASRWRLSTAITSLRVDEPRGRGSCR